MFENIDLSLIQKYDKPGPRYTSYPTALHFDEKFTVADYLKAIPKEEGEDLSLYFHLPFCDTLCYYCGCNMIVTQNRDRIQNYLRYLKKEIELLSTALPASRKVKQLHWGGGTPTYLNPQEIAALVSFINSKFEFQSEAEEGCEIDPRGLTYEHLAALREGGFNRISMGIQDFNEKVQKAINRIQPEELSAQVIRWVRDLEFQSINVDLIYGLPFQSVETFSETVERVIALSPDRIALFNYAHVPWLKKHMKLISPETLPIPEEKLNILKMSIEKLTKAGYLFIGMDHFAKPDNELSVALKNKQLGRNFQGYTTHASLELYGLGITSISQLSQLYAQNYKTEKEYFAALDQNILPIAKGFSLSEDDLLRREVILKLMCDFELDFERVEKKFNINFESYFEKGLSQLEEMIQDKLVILSNKKLVVTEMGRMLIRNIAMNFDWYIEQKTEQNSAYSKTV